VFSGPQFSVEGKNEERGLAGVSYLKKLYVTVDGITVTLMKSRRALVLVDPSINQSNL
jgi:hypothetical protein